MSKVGSGISHKCNPSTRLNNLTATIEESGQKLSDQVVSTLLKRKLENKKNSSSISLSQPKGGRHLKVSIGMQNIQKSSKQQLLSVDDMSKIQTSVHLSQNKTLELAKALRVATKNSKSIEPNLKEKLSEKSHCLDKYFDAKMFNFVYTKGKQTTAATETVAYCIDTKGLIEHLAKKRSVSNFHLKFGIDGGGGFLKVCLSIQSNNSHLSNEKHRQKYEDGICAKKFKDSGVNKLMILGLARDSQENYQNVQKLWSALNINELKGTIATDLKLANISTGIMSHSSNYPCTWCYAAKNEMHICGDYRTIQNVKENYQKWRNAGAVKADAKNFKNCIHPPIFTDEKEDRSLLEIITPPELHLMLGVVNTLYNHLLEKFEKDALMWAEACCVVRDVRHGSSSFNGNSCKTLLEKIDILRSRSSIPGTLNYVETFDKFKMVVKACFSYDLNPSYKNVIEDFKKSYLQLGISVTPKIHAVFFHVPDFCQIVQKGLGFYSEQTMESVHSDFKNTWVKYTVSINHPDYPERLKRALCEYNSLHS